VFEGFALESVDVGEVTLRVRHGGLGEPVVLLHGHPRTQLRGKALAILPVQESQQPLTNSLQIGEV
jgi:haloacetate dehalogenase